MFGPARSPGRRRRWRGGGGGGVGGLQARAPSPSQPNVSFRLFHAHAHAGGTDATAQELPLPSGLYSIRLEGGRDQCRFTGEALLDGRCAVPLQSTTNLLSMHFSHIQAVSRCPLPTPTYPPTPWCTLQASCR